MIKFKKTSSTAPIFVYFTVHFDDNGGDMNTYPKDFKNQVYIVAYGIEGLSDHVDPEVYDAHEAFQIDKTKMKMLVPLDMNGKQLMNVNYDLKFGDIYKIEDLYVRNYSTSSSKPSQNGEILRFHNVRFTSSKNIFLHSINVYSTFENDIIGKPRIGISNRGNKNPTRYHSFVEGLFDKNKNSFTKDISFPAYNGLHSFEFTDLNGKLFIKFILIYSDM